MLRREKKCFVLTAVLLSRNQSCDFHALSVLDNRSQIFGGLPRGTILNVILSYRLLSPDVHMQDSCAHELKEENAYVVFLDQNLSMHPLIYFLCHVLHDDDAAGVVRALTQLSLAERHNTPRS